MSTKKRRKRIFIYVAVLSLLSFLSFKHWAFDFDKKIDCVSYKLGDDTYENTVVRLVGRMNRSLILKDYISYTLYIDDVRYPEENHLLLPFSNFDEIRRFGSGKLYRLNFTPVNEIQSTYIQHDRNNRVYIEYKYWEDHLDITKQRYLNFGILFFSDDNFDDIIIAINERKNGNEYKWTNKVGYKVIVSGYDLRSAESTLEKLNMKVFNEDGSVVE